MGRPLRSAAEQDPSARQRQGGPREGHSVPGPAWGHDSGQSCAGSRGFCGSPRQHGAFNPPARPLAHVNPSGWHLAPGRPGAGGLTGFLVGSLQHAGLGLLGVNPSFLREWQGRRASRLGPRSSHVLSLLPLPPNTVHPRSITRASALRGAWSARPLAPVQPEAALSPLRDVAPGRAQGLSPDSSQERSTPSSGQPAHPPERSGSALS